jgi:DNA topoisomerase 2-associated protein PAT1
MLTMLTLLVACFDQLDVVIQAPSLDSFQDTAERKEVDRQTQSFLGSVLQSVLPVVAKASLRLISGLLGLLLDRCNIVAITQTRVCGALISANMISQFITYTFSPAWLY